MFGNRATSVKKQLPENSDCQDSDATKNKREFSHSKTLYNLEVFESDPDGKDDAVSFGET